MVKVAMAAVLVGLGAANRYWLLPRLNEDARSGAVASRLLTNIRREAVLALVILACTAVLGESTPARHAPHERNAVAAPSRSPGH